nr:SNF2-related protein [uncultured Cellulosilyticum sp.]
MYKHTYTPFHSKYFATQLTLKRASSSIDSLAASLGGARVDLNPHQIDAALFAFRSPLSNGVILADEVGLGKTIEAGIVMAQYWAERKRKILLIVPAALRNQWRGELDDKFYLKAIILEGKNYNSEKKQGVLNPFNREGEIVICSYQFAAKNKKDLINTKWDLVVIDEAHKLRSVYKKTNVLGNTLKQALQGRKKLLLTATPLQNSLLELYGLVSIIDDHVFGDVKTFKEMYVNVEDENIRNYFLKKRISPFCKRTLRKQVVEYVPYTKRLPILQKYEPSKEEELLYNKVAEYLQSDKLYALPNSQRKLMTMILWKLLASSSFAIAGTLNSLIKRLENMLEGIESDLELEDYDNLEEVMEEWDNEEVDEYFTKVEDRDEIKKELEQLREYLRLAQKIKINAKGQNLLKALEQGFDKAQEIGALRKAVIFTESKRTQEYLFNLLTYNGYRDKIVFLNGSNNDSGSKAIYNAWIKKHAGEDVISGSKQADMKAAIVEAFRDEASILIGTEAAAEGINLQFCSLLVNYDLPWNPQRIEQRIGRCHRYGQKNDVVVINFLNINNQAEQRVYEILDKKFKLFEGVFGSSDEVLGSIESGIDFERRIMEIYQNARDAETIKKSFDKIQDDLEEQIQAKLSNTRQALLENFDEEVSSLLKFRNEETKVSLSQYEKWLYGIVQSELASEIEADSIQGRFYYKGKEYQEGFYNINWKLAEQMKDHFLRLEHPMIQHLIALGLHTNVTCGQILINYSKAESKVSFLEQLNVKKGYLVIDKLINESFEYSEQLLISAVTDDGRVLDSEIGMKLMEFPVAQYEIKEKILLDDKVNEVREENIQHALQSLKENDFKYYQEECEKIDAWTEDLKQGIEKEIKQIEREISEVKKVRHQAKTLEDAIAFKNQLSALEKKRYEKIKVERDEHEKIEKKNEELQKSVEKHLKGRQQVEEVIKLRWEII